MVKKSAPILVEVIDGRTIASSTITHETTPLELRIGKHAEKIDFNIISTPHHLVILGLPWWKRTTLSSIGNPKPSLSAHNDAPLKNPKPRKTLSSLAKNPMVKNPKRVGTNSSPVKSCGQEPPSGQNKTLSYQESCQESYQENQPCLDLLCWS
jgi:hypothetical protein